MGRLTTHVLDTARGKPGAGIRVEVYGGDGNKLAETRTNSDGRTDAPLLDGARFQPGAYELVCAPIKLLNGDGAPARVFLVER